MYHTKPDLSTGKCPISGVSAILPVFPSQKKLQQKHRHAGGGGNREQTFAKPCEHQRHAERRRPRNEGRVRRLEELRRQRAARRDRMGSVNLKIAAGEKSGKIVSETTDLCKSFDERSIVSNLNF